MPASFDLAATTNPDGGHSLFNRLLAALEAKLETFTQPKIAGYRQLNEAEAALMNEIKAHGESLGDLVAKLRATEGIDGRWISIGATDLQTGLMALTRGVAQPTTF